MLSLFTCLMFGLGLKPMCSNLALAATSNFRQIANTYLMKDKITETFAAITERLIRALQSEFSDIVP